MEAAIIQQIRTIYIMKLICILTLKNVAMVTNIYILSRTNFELLKFARLDPVTLRKIGH